MTLWTSGEINPWFCQSGRVFGDPTGFYGNSMLHVRSSGPICLKQLYHSQDTWIGECTQKSPVHGCLCAINFLFQAVRYKYERWPERPIPANGWRFCKLPACDGYFFFHPLPWRLDWCWQL